MLKNGTERIGQTEVEGDEVIIFGKDFPITRLVDEMGSIPYEILSGISQRVKRVYFQEKCKTIETLTLEFVFKLRSVTVFNQILK